MTQNLVYKIKCPICDKEFLYNIPEDQVKDVEKPENFLEFQGLKCPHCESDFFTVDYWGWLSYTPDWQKYQKYEYMLVFDGEEFIPVSDIYTIVHDTSTVYGILELIVPKVLPRGPKTEKSSSSWVFESDLRAIKALELYNTMDTRPEIRTRHRASLGGGIEKEYYLPDIYELFRINFDYHKRSAPQQSINRHWYAAEWADASNYTLTTGGVDTTRDYYLSRGPRIDEYTLYMSEPASPTTSGNISDLRYVGEPITAPEIEDGWTRPPDLPDSDRVQVGRVMYNTTQGMRNSLDGSLSTDEDDT